MEKITFDDILSLMPAAVMDDFLQLKEHIRTLKNIKLKQKVLSTEHLHQITFNSDYGFQYTVVYDDRTGEFANWVYLIAYNNHTHQRKFGVRKRNYISEALEHISRTDDALADELFGKIKLCNSCWGDPGCLHGVVLSYRNRLIRTCNMRFELGSSHEDFDRVKTLLTAMDAVYGEETDDEAITVGRVIYELPLEVSQWRSQSPEGLCEIGAEGAYSVVEIGEGDLTIRPADITKWVFPSIECMPENAEIDADKAYIDFEFTAETRWYIQLEFTDGKERYGLDFASAIGTVPEGHDGRPGRHTGRVKLRDIAPNLHGRMKLERIKMSSTWWQNASKLTVRRFVFSV